MELPGEGFTLDWSSITVGKTNPSEPEETTFYGNLLNFYFDGDRLFDRLPSDDPVDFTQTPSTPPPDVPLRPTDPITFPPRLIYHIRISRVPISDDARIRFLFRTHDGNGVLMFTERRSRGNFLGAELVNGQLVVVAEGGTGPTRVTLPSGSPSLADGQWHEVDLTRAGPRRFLVRVDGQELPGRLYYPPSTGHERIFFGGVPDIGQLPSVMSSSKGFTGCMSTVVINGLEYNLQDIIADEPALQQLTAGCSRKTLDSSFSKI